MTMDQGGANVGAAINFTTSANNVNLYDGSGSSSVTASDASAHMLLAVFNGSSSILTVDATDTTGLNAGTRFPAANQISLFIDGFGSNLKANWMEAGYQGGGFTGTQRTDLHTIAAAYWATP
jgi:hypothetical protein